MIQLSPIECRVLGTLVEKAQTTPNQYPLTLNALTAGCNQKNNREPLLELSDDEVLESVDSLKGKSLVREAILTGSRVNKFKHVMRDALQINVAEMAVLTELLLRGPQSPGELKTRCDRLVPPGTTPGVGSPEAVMEVLSGLMKREEPLVRHLGRRPGERADRYAQLLCPDLHPLDAALNPAGSGAISSGAARVDAGALAELLEQVGALTSKLEAMEQRLARLEGR